MYNKNEQNNLLEDVSKHVTTLFKENLPDWAVYHNLSHTINTVNACEEIGKGIGLSEEDLEILYISAWFHDTGYLFQSDGHEEISSKLSSNYLNSRNYPKEKIERVVECIMATKIFKKPNGLLEFVICDADLISLGGQDYFEKNNQLKIEIEQREDRKISELEWLKRSINFLSTHKYFTEYARQNYSDRLKANIKYLKEKIAELQ